MEIWIDAAFLSQLPLQGFGRSSGLGLSGFYDASESVSTGFSQGFAASEPDRCGLGFGVWGLGFRVNNASSTRYLSRETCPTQHGATETLEAVHVHAKC